MSIADVAATGEGAWPSRFALTPTLSPGERGNFRGVVTMRMSVDASEPCGHQVALASKVNASESGYF